MIKYKPKQPSKAISRVYMNGLLIVLLVDFDLGVDGGGESKEGEGGLHDGGS